MSLQARHIRASTRSSQSRTRDCSASALSTAKTSRHFATRRIWLSSHRTKCTHPPPFQPSLLLRVLSWTLTLLKRVLTALSVIVRSTSIPITLRLSLRISQWDPRCCSSLKPSLHPWSTELCQPTSIRLLSLVWLRRKKQIWSSNIMWRSSQPLSCLSLARNSPLFTMVAITHMLSCLSGSTFTVRPLSSLVIKTFQNRNPKHLRHGWMWPHHTWQ